MKKVRTDKMCNGCIEVKPLYMFKEDGIINPNRICNKCLRKERRKKYHNDEPKKTGARQMLAIALKSGHLIKEPCNECGSNDNVHGHHPDYEHPLQIVWLCARHHMRLHAKERKLNTTAGDNPVNNDE